MDTNREGILASGVFFSSSSIIDDFGADLKNSFIQIVSNKEHITGVNVCKVNAVVQELVLKTQLECL